MFFARQNASTAPNSYKYSNTLYIYQHRPADIEKFLSGSFQDKVAAAEGKLEAKDREAGWVFGRGSEYPPRQLGSVIFHCFGHWKSLSRTKSVNSE